MKLIVPDYYNHFKCIADQCNHTCCTGWEIDIDDDTLRKYKYIGGSLGQKLKKHVDFESGSFRLLEGDRCPFLDERGLCEIICEKGEHVLCDICRDHPRFRNFFDSRIEMGIGMSCEAAAKLIIEYPHKVRFIEIEDDGFDTPQEDEEKAALELRDKAVEILQRSLLTPEERIAEFLFFTGATLPDKTPAQWADTFRSLERLDRSWDKYLDLLSEAKELSYHDGIEFQQLSVYFAYRHLSQSYEDGLMEAHAAFTALSVIIISTIYNMTESGSLDVLEDIARLYSAEIEYSQDNLDFLHFLLDS